jgi:hypothetical protein
MDILEGVNDQVPNTSTLHTGSGVYRRLSSASPTLHERNGDLIRFAECTMPNSRLQTG